MRPSKTYILGQHPVIGYIYTCISIHCAADVLKQTKEGQHGIAHNFRQALRDLDGNEIKVQQFQSMFMMLMISILRNTMFCK